MLYRLVENNQKPILKVVATSKEHGDVPTFNTIGMIKGVESLMNMSYFQHILTHGTVAKEQQTMVPAQSLCLKQ